MSGKRPHTLEFCQIFATSKNGKCLSNCYINQTTHMLWVCDYGHTPWKSTFKNILKNHWCPSCSGNIIAKLEDCHNVAASNDGKCLSIKYINMHTKMKWQCKYNHVWEAPFNNIKNNNYWCKKCSSKNSGRKKLTLYECLEFAKSKNGICLSNNYINNNTKMEWQCTRGHIWKATFSNIKGGKWCPGCVHQISKAQVEIYQHLANNFNNLNSILNDTCIIKPLHLDIYIPELMLAIEYDGEYWHYSEWAIKNGAMERQKKKDKICKERGIKLIRVREKCWKKSARKELDRIISFISKNM